MVFHTAPPHPASNARCTCKPELLGGAEASQKGFGERMPAKLMLRSAMRHQPFMNRTSSEFAVLHGHHRGGGSAHPDAVSPRIDSGQTSFEMIADLDEAFLSFELQQGSER